MGSIAPSGVQKHFCMISGSRDESNSKCGMRFQKFYTLDNLIFYILVLLCGIKMSQPPKIFINPVNIRFQDNYIVDYITFLTSYTPYHFANISAP